LPEAPRRGGGAQPGLIDTVADDDELNVRRIAQQRGGLEQVVEILRRPDDAGE
jgi:hypothetical protein